MTIHVHHQEPKTTLQKARDFFERNPDEILTRSDICVKFDCSKDTACIVAKALIMEGVSRNQLPRDDARVELRKRREAKQFPECLTPSERKVVESMKAGATLAAAAAASGIKFNTMESYLKVARRKAGVKTTAELLQAYSKAVAK